jgi:hypothetical protein
MPRMARYTQAQALHRAGTLAFLQRTKAPLLERTSRGLTAGLRIRPQLGQERPDRTRQRVGSTKLYQASSASPPVRLWATQPTLGNASSDSTVARSPQSARRIDACQRVQP